MGKEFGKLARIRGLVTYKISAYEQRAFAGMISHSLPNLWTRFTDNIFRVAPPFIVTYLVMDYLDQEHARLQRKNPKDYENDE